MDSIHDKYIPSLSPYKYKVRSACKYSEIFDDFAFILPTYPISSVFWLCMRCQLDDRTIQIDACHFIHYDPSFSWLGAALLPMASFLTFLNSPLLSTNQPNISVLVLALMLLGVLRCSPWSWSCYIFYLCFWQSALDSALQRLTTIKVNIQLKFRVYLPC